MDELNDDPNPIFPTPEDKTNVLTRLRLLGVREVCVSFSGSGDSGSIENVDLVTADGKYLDASNEMINGWERKGYYDSTKKDWINELTRSEMSLPDLLEKMTYAALEDSQIDWYNNEGGQGTFSIDFSESPPAITLNVEVNITSTQDHEFSY